MSKRKNILAKIGGYRITKDIDARHDYITIEGIDGSWSVRYRDDNIMYSAMLVMVKDPSYYDGLQRIIAMSYITSDSLLDAEFAKDFFTAYSAMMERRASSKEEPGRKEQDTAIDEAERMQKIENEIEEAQKE